MTKLEKIENNLESEVKKLKMLEVELANLESLRNERFVDKVPPNFDKTVDYSKGMNEMLEYQIKNKREEIDKLKNEMSGGMISDEQDEEEVRKAA